MQLVHLLTFAVRSELTLLYNVTLVIELHNPDIIGIWGVGVRPTTNIKSLLVIEVNITCIVATSRTRDTSDLFLESDDTFGIICVIETRFVLNKQNIGIVSSSALRFGFTEHIDQMIVLRSLVEVNLLKTCFFDARRRQNTSIPNKSTQIGEFSEESRSIAICLSQFATNVSSTVGSGLNVENFKCRGISTTFNILVDPIVSFLELLRVRDSNLRNILNIVVKTRIDDINTVNLTSGGIQDNIKLNILPRVSNDLISRRNCLIVTNTDLINTN